MELPKPEIIQLPRIVDPRGSLTFIQCPDQIPFPMERVYWTYDVPGGESRGGYAFQTQQQVIISLSGSFDVVVTFPDKSKERFVLNRSYLGLYLPAGTWRHIENFATNSIALHLSSHPYAESDYIRDFEKYCSFSFHHGG